MMQNKFLQNPNADPPSWSPFSLLLSLANISGEIPPESDNPPDPTDKYSSDEFRMYDFKVRPCTRSRSHDWTECPYAHPGEKARRRDPRNHSYSGVSCPDFRKGVCRKGDSCEFAHGVFESWLHPARYRTQICKDGADCRRRVCFFAHSPEQVRVLPILMRRGVGSCDGSPMRGFCVETYFAKGGIPVSPTSTLISPASSPPVSPAMKEIMASIEGLRLGDVGGEFRRVFCSGSPAAVPAVTPAVEVAGGEGCEIDGVVGRVESGRALRVKMYERLSREIGLGGSEFDPAGQNGPDFGWVSELIK